jgi:hypothetical protein
MSAWPDDAVYVWNRYHNSEVALITMYSSYLLHLLQLQQAGNLALLMQLQEAKRAALLHRPQVAQLLNKVYAQSQLQQQQQQQQRYDSDGCDDNDDISVLYVPTDDEGC